MTDKKVPLLVRLPADVHDRLREEAFRDRISINALILKYLQGPSK